MADDVRLIERLVRHQIYVQQFGGGQVKRAMPIIRQLAKDIRQRIQAADATEFQMARLLALETDLQFIAAQAADEIQQTLDLEDFAAQELGFATRLLGAAVAVDLATGVSPEVVRALTTRRKMRLISGKSVKQLTIPEMWSEFAGAVAKDARRVVEKGILSGATQQQMARDVGEMVATRSRSQAATVVRTATNGIGDAARGMIYDANADILDGERFLATLDSHTTITCAGYDQTEHALGSGPRPPLHYGCRSIRVPIIKPEYRLSTLGERASMDGPVSNQLTYGGFLKRQTKEFQDDVLGPKRAQLFRSGKLRIDQFTDDMGRSLTLEELAASMT